MSEAFAERTAGIWIPTIFYAAGGVYLLAFYALAGASALHLLALGVTSILVSALLFRLSKWGYWVGLFTFPLLLVEVAYALTFSVNMSGLYPSYADATFNASMIVYLIFLCLSVLLLVDRRNVLRSDRIMDRLRSTISPREQEPKVQQAKAKAAA